jgi:RHS repeat-associated protein
VLDRQGAPAMLVEGDGTIAWRLYRDAFGRAKVDTLSRLTCPLRASSQYADEESGLNYNLFRYYDPVLGRYINRDPIGEAGGINLYGFCHNSPVGFVDPLGLSGSCDALGMAAVMGSSGNNSGDYNWWSDSSVWAAAGDGALQGGISYVKGIVVDVASAAVIAGVAIGAVAIGVPAAIVSGTLIVAGGIGTALTTISIINNPTPENISYNIGAITGSGFVGGATGRTMSSKLSPEIYQPAPGAATIKSELNMRWIDPDNPTSFMAGAANYLLNFNTANMTGPSIGGAAGVITLSGAGGASLVMHNEPSPLCP